MADDRMVDESAAEAKQRGNVALAAKDYTLAVKEYTAAISHDASNHVFFSNRSAAYASLKRYTEALADAEQCIKLKPEFAKGFGRKGAALHGMGREQAAIAAYDDGLKVDADSAALNKGREDAVRATAPRTAPRTTPQPAAARPEGSGAALFRLIVSTAVLVCAALYLGSFGSARFFRYALTASVCSYVVDAWTAVRGEISMAKLRDQEWVVAVMGQHPDKRRRHAATDPVLAALLVFCCLGSRPVPFALAGSLTSALSGCNNALDTLLGRHAPTSISGRLQPRLAALRTWLANYALSWVANMEIAALFYMLIALATPARSILQPLLYSQMLRIRFHGNAATQLAWGECYTKLKGVPVVCHAAAAVKAGLDKAMPAPAYVAA